MNKFQRHNRRGVNHQKRKRELKSQISYRSNNFKSPFERDLYAMNEVWKMLKNGATRWLGEIGRQY